MIVQYSKGLMRDLTVHAWYIKPLKAIIDFDLEIAVPLKSAKDAPFFMPQIDLLYADPDVTHTQLGFAQRNFGEMLSCFLIVNAYDIKVILKLSRLLLGHKFNRRRFEGLFWQSASDAINVSRYCYFGDALEAPGEFGHWKNQQLNADIRWERVIHNTAKRKVN